MAGDFDGENRSSPEEGHGKGHSADRKFVTALARGLDVLRAFHARDCFLGNLEIAERTQLPKATVTRITYTLCTLGYLVHEPATGKYQLAPAAIMLGHAALTNLRVRQIAHDLMEETANNLGAPVALGITHIDSALYVDIARGGPWFDVQLDIGSRLPLATSAMGRALLVAMCEAQRAIYMERLKQKFHANWPKMRDGIYKAIADYKSRGFVMSIGEWRSDINAIAVPLVAADGSGIYAFNCGAPPAHFCCDRLVNETGPAIVKLAGLVNDGLADAHQSIRTKMAPSSTLAR